MFEIFRRGEPFPASPITGALFSGRISTHSLFVLPVNMFLRYLVSLWAGRNLYLIIIIILCVWIFNPFSWQTVTPSDGNQCAPATLCFVFSVVWPVDNSTLYNTCLLLLLLLLTPPPPSCFQSDLSCKEESSFLWNMGRTYLGSWNCLFGFLVGSIETKRCGTAACCRWSIKAGSNGAVHS